MTTHFTVHCSNDQIWNLTELIHFLSQNQNQCIRLKINPEAICLTTLGLYNILDAFKFKQVVIETCNLFERHDAYQFAYITDNLFLQEQPNTPTELHCWTLNKVFYTCYGRPTAARLGLAGYLHTHYGDISHLHFSTPADPDHVALFEMNKLFTWSTKAAALAADMADKMPLTITGTDTYNRYHYNYADPLTQEYQHCFVDIVVEAHVLGNTFFPTEKTTRPMWLKKPFIIFASKNYLEYLRQMGFRTFGDFWDEDYDGYEGRDRLLKIQNLIDTIAQKPIEQLEKMYWDMQYTLDHNYNLLKTQTYQKKITQL